MGSGQYESTEGPVRGRLGAAFYMGAATLVGSMMPVIPFAVFPRTVAVVVAVALSGLVALWISKEKRDGLRGAVKTFAILGAAIGLTLAIVGPIPGGA